MMHVPRVCAKCGKTYQAPEASHAGPPACPDCDRAPASAPPETASEPLSLDDEPIAAPSSPRTRSPRSWLLRVVISLGLLLVVFGLAFAAARSGTGWVPAYGWAMFADPEGAFQIEMPATVSSEREYPAIPDFPMTHPGRKFSARGNFSGVETSVGWVEVDRDRVKMLRLEDLAGGEIARRKKDLNATSVEITPRKRGDRDGVEARYSTPSGVAVDRIMFLGEGPRPRVYVLSYIARAIPQDGVPVERFLNSFQVRK